MNLKCLACAGLLLGLNAPLFAAPPKVGDTVGTLRFSDAAGTTVALDQPDVLYIVDFWSIGCQPCIHEIPDLDRLQHDYDAGGRVRIVGVVWGDWKPKELPKIAKQFKTTRPVFADYQHWFDTFETHAFPTKLFIKNGVLIHVVQGAGSDSYGELKRLIDAEFNDSQVKW
ncbi:MAG TPA: TlpA disulfide reductase family protein [Candidatus Polarisedimenticolaceae bacterium]|nr:TlpA disulfide reductase family protein [Candidatus Polarisedimenticolaceae bacterium]